MRGLIDDIARENGSIPLGWAGSTMQMNYLNFGDALSPVMVSLAGGLPVHRVPTKSSSPRMAAVGTIGHGFAGGDVYFWGTGCSNWLNPGKGAERQPFLPSPDSRFHVRATRGPVSERLLNGGGTGSGIHGDPVWLLPQFYAAPVRKKWKLGCILHLSELADRDYEAHPHAADLRYVVPAEFTDDVHLITTVTPITIDGVRDKIDEIRACERIVSTSLHGMVIAESYGIPCLYFSPQGDTPGPIDLALEPDGNVDLRIVDLYRGMGRETLRAFGQPRTRATDWGRLMADIDANWRPIDLRDADALLDALPVAPAPLEAPPGGSVWDHPVIRSLVLQHDVTQLRRDDKAGSPKPVRTTARGVAAAP
ncbi:polysaccharide pyruvyl transferase family protein [Ancylobacter sp. SL191]|uniref:polysaccharide pyruvyl transferase family protein n=1 Tax=Ancylobacter sp. SL191 TaxID=2995166 RepID=UPI0022707C5D|nr:polysaccharide pyruvyl transferase family protein [Ancylobacter sp. SL191]WAC27086.1 polysaccharide pyruvyl transferase family protein [Ancylobacter sp. SL191]